VATALTAAIMVQDSSVTFSPTSFSTAGTVYTYDQVVDDKFFIYVEYTSTTNADFMTFTVAAGSTTVAWQRDLGTLAVTLTSTGKTAAYRKLIGPIESARFMGSTGAITITTSSSANTSGTGFIGVAHMPYVIPG
jgi:hypothetical protein